MCCAAPRCPDGHVSVCVCVFCMGVCVRLIGRTRVASVQSEPGQQNLLIQPPLGRKRGLRQVSMRGFGNINLLLCCINAFFFYFQESYIKMTKNTLEKQISRIQVL